AEMRGAARGSSELIFEPGPITAGKYTFSIGTAGATGLVLHTLYLPLALKSADTSELTLQGGTHVKMSPCFHFLDSTWRAYMEALGLKIRLRMIRPGFYPRGGGTIEVRIKPCAEIQPLQLLGRRDVTRVTGLSAVSGLPEQIAQRQARRAANRLRDFDAPVDLRQESWPGDPGTLLAVELNTTPAPTLFFGLG